MPWRDCLEVDPRESEPKARRKNVAHNLSILYAPVIEEERKKEEECLE